MKSSEDERGMDVFPCGTEREICFIDVQDVDEPLITWLLPGDHF